MSVWIVVALFVGAALGGGIAFWLQQRQRQGERDATAQIDCAHMAFGVSRHATRQVMREIDRFLKNQR